MTVPARPRIHDPLDVPRVGRLLAAFLLIAFVAQGSLAALRDSVTIDEFVGLPVGLYTLQAVDFRSESMNPPFFRSFAALPLMSGGTLAPQIPPMNEVNDWAMGYRFMEDYRETYHQLFVPARCMVLLAAAILAALVLHWATELYGWEAGLGALFLFTFSPTMLAQAHLLTLDVSGALGWTSVAYLTWRMLEKPTTGRAVGVGLMLGLAPVMKLSGVTAPIVVAVIVALRAAGERDVSWRRWLALLAIAYFVSLLVLNGLYRFEGFGMAFRDVDFDSAKLRSIASAAPWLRLPIPKPFLKSLDVLFVGDEPTEPAYFLAGKWSLQGWWYYHLVAFGLKTSLPLLFLGAFGLVAWGRGRSGGLRDYCVYVPVLGIFVANSILNPLNIGVRHALPVYPLLAIGAAPWLAGPITRFAEGMRDTRTSIATVVAIVLCGWHLIGTLAIAPRYLEFFNELAGGPRGGHRWLVDSNIDWGQDLLRLSDFMRENHLPLVNLAYFGRVDPSVYGIRYRPLVEGESHGVAVISASFYAGRPYWIWRSPGKLEWAHHGEFHWLARYEPIARVGSMFVFQLP